MSDNSSTIKYAMIGLGALAIAGLAWYLSQDQEGLDYNEFTKEKLEKLMKEVQLEFTCIYARNYNLLLKVKDADENFNEDEVMRQMLTLVKKETKDKEEQIVEDYKTDNGKGITMN